MRRRGRAHQGAALAIEATCRALRLPTVGERAALLAEVALRDRLTHRAYRAELLGAELDDREARRRERHIDAGRQPDPGRGRCRGRPEWGSNECGIRW